MLDVDNPRYWRKKRNGEVFMLLTCCLGMYFGGTVIFLIVGAHAVFWMVGALNTASDLHDVEHIDISLARLDHRDDD